ncbi:ABC transporter permease [Adhaeribacter swui]|uniref:ABC transporter permease n=1 Tax=Adhaeribacter swui TaxID=2086471 RepID=A0A7G7G6R6_9BACT|nr:ABC transporter permease [Adhaeribacter swui]QNF32850.1 ABC transporter permease [Adhaeribacter swui]
MLLNYFKIAFRNLLRHKAFSLLNIAGLSVGVAVALLIFLIVRFELSFDTFHQKRDRTYRVVNDFTHEAGKDYQVGVPFPFVPALKTDFPQLEKVTTTFQAYNSQITVLDEQGAITKKFREENSLLFTEPEFFQIFDYPWLAGDPKKVLVEPNTVALTRSIAEKYFGSWQKALGKFIKLDNKQLLQVNGILKDLPDNTDFPIQIAVSFPTLRKFIDANEFTNWGSVWSSTQCYLVLPPKASPTQFDRSLASFLKKHNSDDRNHTYKLQALSDLHFNTRYPSMTYRSISKTTVLSLVLIGAFILIIACINFVNLATAQAIGRAKETGIRKVLGSNRGHLIVQFLGETFFIVLLAVSVAVLLVLAVLPFVRSISNLPDDFQLPLSLEMVGFLLFLILVVTVLSGFYPALILSGFQPVQALKSKMTLQTVGGISLRKALVVMQFSISQVLVIATLIAITQMDYVRKKDLGYNQEAILLVSVPQDSLSQFKLQTLKNRFQALSAVQKVSLHFAAPSSGSNSMTNFRFGKATEDAQFPVNLKAGDVDYFSTFQLRLVAGRAYFPSDTAREVVVNEKLLRQVGVKHAQDAIGQTIRINDRNYPVVGVVQDFHNVSLRDPIAPTAILANKSSYRQVGLKLKPANADMKETLRTVEQIWNETFPEYVYEASFLDERLAEFYEGETKLAQLFKIFAAIAIFIGCLGLYGLVSFVAMQKTKEIGIRKVLGASLPNIVSLLSRDFLKLVLLANVLAWPLAWWAMQRWLQDFEYRTPIGWWMFAVAGLGALLIALITVSFQAIKAAVANPVEALRSE